MTNDWHIEYETEHCKAPGHAIIEAQTREMAEAIFLAQRPDAFILRSTEYDEATK